MTWVKIAYYWPVRAHPALLNVNIAPFPNVDIVADAHILPFVPESVNAIYCEAVLEHLYDPDRAVAEMYKALKPGGKVYACTPFIFAYHGYPYHYQNFTLTGHQRLFEKHGFRIENAGVAVGPTYALMSLNGAFLYEFFPKPLNWILGKTCGLLARFIRPFDIVLNKRSNAHVMASTTYLLACKS
jgi:SAM-dependent methyltransferase